MFGVEHGWFLLPEMFVPTMPVPLPNWLTPATGSIRQLADRPWTLFLILLALNAIARPCSATAHDAKLYSLQALNVAEAGAYADDVFLRYGSQDQFSLFSQIIGPIVAELGVRPAFFLCYLVFNTLFIAALFRLVRTLIDDPLISTLAIVYLVTAPLTYGGHDIFMVHEQFFTPRINGMTLTLFALERLLRNCFVTAFVLLGIGLLMHPLMAFGGVLIALGYLASTLLPARTFSWLAASTLLAFAVLLCTPTYANWIFGTMDDDWHHSIRLAVGYNYPDTWPIEDWLNLAVSFALPIAACFYLYRDDPLRRRFLIAVTLAGAVGFVTTVAASMLPYALLFQAQPYRVLWILKALQIPLGFLLIARWSESQSLPAKLAALALVAFFCVVHQNPQELLIIAMALPISFAIGRMGDEHVKAGWWWYATARGFVLGAIGWMAYRCWFFVAQRAVIAQHFDWSELVLFDLVSPIVCLIALARFRPFPSGTEAGGEGSSPIYLGLPWACAALAILAPVALFSMEAFATLRHEHTRLGGDMTFVAEFVRERGVSSPPTPLSAGEGRNRPSIYCSLGRPDLLWIDVGATSYFDILQTAGVMFHRSTAVEIDRRIALVAPFEMAHQRDEGIFLSEVKKVGMENLFKLKFDSPSPTRQDLVRLCQEPGLDYVVIPQEFPGLYSASNGRVFVYECYKVRTTAGLAFSARPAPGER